MEIVADIGNFSYPVVHYHDWKEINISAGIPYVVEAGSGGSEYGPQGPPGPMPGMPPEELHRMFIAQHILQLYVTPCFVVFGIVSNMFSCFVLELSSEQAQSSTHYLLAKLVADTVFLLNLLCLWLTDMGVDMFKMGGWCHFTYFVSNSSNFLSLWYLVGYSVDGFIAMVFSSKTASFCTETRAKIVIALLAVVAVPVFLNISLTVEAVDTGPASVCVPMTLFIDAVKYLGRIDMFINSILPYTSLQVILVWCVLHRICCYPKKLTTPCARTNSISHVYKINFLLYILMLTSNIVLKLPTQVFRMYQAIEAMRGTVSQDPMDYAWLQLMNYPYNLSFSITTIALASGSANYRDSCMNMCRKLSRFVRHLFGKTTSQNVANHIEDIQVISTEQQTHKPEPV